MRRALAACVGLAALALPGHAAAGACSPLNCAPSQFTFAHGSLLGVRIGVDAPLRVIDLQTAKTRWRLPPGVVVGDTLVHQDRSLLTWYDAARGTRVADAVVQQHGAFTLVGASQDGRRAVLARTQRRSTTFAVVSPARQRLVKLGGNRWSFDALAGDRLFLIRNLKRGYEIRVVHLRSGVLDRRPLKDPRGSSRIWGAAWSRVSSSDGRYLFTLYVGGDGGSMIHQLDTRTGAARCIDLPGSGEWGAAIVYALVPSPDGRTLWAVSPGYGRVAAIDVRRHVVRDVFSFDGGSWNQTTGIGAVSPDGKRLAVTDAYHLWFVDLVGRKVRSGETHVAIALAFSPDRRHLWAVGERSRVVPLRFA